MADGKLTKTRVDQLQPGETIWDVGGVRGFAAKRHAGGGTSFILKYRFDGQQRWLTIGTYGSITLDQGRKAAEAARGKIALGIDPAAERRSLRAQARADARKAQDTVLAVGERFIEEHAKPFRRSWQQPDRAFKLYVYPAWGTRPISDIRRSDVVRLLDQIAKPTKVPGQRRKRGGPVMADHVLAAVRKLFNWHAARDDEFRSPLVKGLARTRPKELARTRTLSDAELRAVWIAAGKASPSTFGALVRFLILTAQRRGEAAGAHWLGVEHAEGAGLVWLIGDDRYKTGVPHAVPLTSEAEAVIGTLPRLGPFIFTTDGRTSFSGFSKAKRQFDRLVEKELRVLDPAARMAPWVLHDLRRTGRSLMSRAGVPADHAERALGHVIPGVRAVYDRHAYLPEKRAALERLAAMVDRILNPPAGNVVELIDKGARVPRTTEATALSEVRRG